MDDQPTPTEEEHERVPDEQPEHEAMQGPGQPDPELPGREREEEDG
jgi:hypothetical protein